MLNCGDSIMTVHPLFQEEGDGLIPISPLQFEVDEIGVDMAMLLNEEWHSVLPVTQKGNLLRNRRSVFYAAHFANRYYATAIWTTPVAANRLEDGFDWLELRRLAISDDSPKNTATRMLKVMRIHIKKKYPELIGLLSYQSVDHHEGTIYKAAGWSAAAKNKSAVWHKGKVRNKQQTASDKIRWEFRLRDSPTKKPSEPGLVADR